jgi:hypothetical protein
MTHFFPIYYILLSIAGVAAFTNAPLLLKLILDHFTKKVDVVPGKSETELYVESRKRKFVETFQLEDANSNVEPLIYNRNAMEETLKDENNEIEQTWGRRILMESTPRGNLLMVYNVYKQSFDYYADNYIPHQMLNAAAMKFVTVFKCRDLFVDETEIPEGHVSKLVAINREQEDAKSKADTAAKKQTMLSGPFVKPKKPTANNKADATKGEPEKKEEPKKDTIKNKFSYRGKMANFSVLNKPKKVFATNGFKTGLLNFGEQLSYAEYKKKQLAGAQ